MKLRNLPLGTPIQTDRGQAKLNFSGDNFCRLKFPDWHYLTVNPGMPVRQHSNGVYVIGAEVV
jgi:hypothetical protein